MRTFVYLLVCVSLLTACNKKSIQLAEVPTANILNVLDHSPAYITLNKKDSSAILNRKNLISTTNWIIHVDKNLSLAAVAPSLRSLYKKRYNKSMHSKGDAKTYFSISNKAMQRISFLKADSLHIMPNDQFSQTYVKEHAEAHMQSHTLRINFEPKNKTTVDGIEIPKEELLAYLMEQKEFVAPNKKMHIYLNFEEHLNFQEFIDGYYLLQRLHQPNIEVDKKIFIYDINKIPDCGCDR
ncbi:MAG: hypothetical protein OIF50_00205 [Flavobacteriaceae bacterium]|nr:hypothetical protein [Flavobacteriaceae bacterium]